MNVRVIAVAGSANGNQCYHFEIPFVPSENTGQRKRAAVMFTDMVS